MSLGCNTDGMQQWTSCCTRQSRCIWNNAALSSSWSVSCFPSLNMSKLMSVVCQTLFYFSFFLFHLLLFGYSGLSSQFYWVFRSGHVCHQWSFRISESGPFTVHNQQFKPVQHVSCVQYFISWSWFLLLHLFHTIYCWPSLYIILIPCHNIRKFECEY